MADGFHKLGEVFAGGIDRQGAFDQGRLRTAQTESALQRARKEQLEATAAEAQEREFANMATLLASNGVENSAVIAGMMRAGRGNAQQLGNALLSGQEQQFRSTLGDPTADPAAQFAAGQGVQGKVLNPFDTVGAGGFTNLREGAPELLTTPLGESMITENVASAGASDALRDLRTAQRTNPAAFRSAVVGAPEGLGGFGKPPSGFVFNPDFNKDLPPGPDNPVYLDARQPVMGAREAAFFNRVAGSAKAMEFDLQTIMEMPSGASTGIFGTGVAATPGTSLLEAAGGALRHAVSEEETRQYNAVLAGMNRALGFIEGQGLVGSNQLVASYDTLLLRPGDTVGDKMLKLAQMKQTVLAGLEPHMASPRVPRVQKEALQQIVDSLEQTIPFTPIDVVRLQNANRAGNVTTMQEVIDATRGQTPARPRAGTTGPPSFATEEEAAAARARGEIQPGMEIMVNGVLGEWED